MRTLAIAALVTLATAAATPVAMGQGWMLAIASDGWTYDVNHTTAATRVNASAVPARGTPGALTYDPYLDHVYGSSTSLDALFLHSWPRQLIGPFGDPSIDMTGIEWKPASNTLYGVSNGSIYTIDTATGTATLVGNTGIPGESNLVYDSTSAVMYMTSTSTDALYSLDLATATATLVGPLNGPTNPRGLAYVPDDDAIYLVCSDTRMLYTVNQTTGSATPIGSTGEHELVGLVWRVFGFADCPPFPADYDNDGGVTGADIGAFLADYEIGAPCADVNRDGGVTPEDLAWFIFCFEQC